MGSTTALDTIVDVIAVPHMAVEDFELLESVHKAELGPVQLRAAPLCAQK